MALKIYIKARATPKVVAAFAERREFDKILVYSKQVLCACINFLTLNMFYARVLGSYAYVEHIVYMAVKNQSSSTF